MIFVTWRLWNIKYQNNTLEGENNPMTLSPRCIKWGEKKGKVSK